MSWEAAKEHEDAYLHDLLLARNNEQRQKWFTSELESLNDLFKAEDGVYSRDEANTEWKTEYEKRDQADVRKLMGLRLRIAALCSSTRDLRVQMAAWSDNRVRVPLDWERFAYQDAAFAGMRLEFFDRVMADMDKGMKELK